MTNEDMTAGARADLRNQAVKLGGDSMGRYKMLTSCTQAQPYL